MFWLICGREGLTREGVDFVAAVGPDEFCGRDGCCGGGEKIVFVVIVVDVVVDDVVVVVVVVGGEAA
jgi:hypothetical protein